MLVHVTTSSPQKSRESYSSPLARHGESLQKLAQYLTPCDFARALVVSQFFRETFVLSEAAIRAVAKNAKITRQVTTYSQLRDCVILGESVLSRLCSYMPQEYSRDLFGTHQSEVVLVAINKGLLDAATILIRFRPRPISAEEGENILLVGMKNRHHPNAFNRVAKELIMKCTFAEANRNRIVLSIAQRGTSKQDFSIWDNLLKTIVKTGPVSALTRSEAFKIIAKRKEWGACAALLETELDKESASYRNKKDRFSPLSQSLIGHICTFLPLPDISTMARSSRTLRVQCLYSPTLWRGIAERMSLPSDSGTIINPERIYFCMYTGSLFRKLALDESILWPLIRDFYNKYASKISLSLVREIIEKLSSIESRADLCNFLQSQIPAKT